MSNGGSKASREVGTEPREFAPRLRTVLVNNCWLSIGVSLSMAAGLANNYINSRYLGLLVFGQYSLLFSSAAYWGISGSGFGVICMKKVAQAEAALSEAISAGTIFQTASALIVLSFTMSVAVLSLRDPRVVWPAVLMGGTGTLQAVINVPVLIYAGKNKMQWQVLNGILALLAIGLLLVLIKFPLGLYAPAFAWLMPAAVIALATYTFLLSKVGLQIPRRDLLMSVLTQGALLTIIPITQIPYYHLDYLTITWFSTGEQLGILSAAGRVVNMFRNMSWIMVWGVLPILMADAKREPEILTRSFNRIILWAVLAGSLVSVGVMGVSDIVIHVLYPGGFESAAPVLRIFAISFVPMLIHWIGMNTLVAADRIKWLSGPYIAMAAGKFMVGFWAVPRFGAEGAAVISVAAEAVLAAVFYTWFARSRELPINWRLVGLVVWIGMVYAGVLVVAGLPVVLKATLGIVVLIAGGFWVGGLHLRDVRSMLSGFRLRPAIDTGERP